jgi:AcrR family transcriptional regulator
MLCKKTMRETILKAAMERFLHYGYPKTTMAEIANDCNMSPGNLYRYFPGKLDLAESIAEHFSQQTLDRLREIVRDKSLNPLEKLRKYHFTKLHHSYHQLEEDTKIYEIAQILKRERPQFSNGQLAKERALLTEILAAGNASGDFNIKDIVFVGEMIQSATMKFSYPQLWSKLTLDKLERELEGVLDLILGGISPKISASSPASDSPAIA